jgi:hypothetical protein
MLEDDDDDDGAPADVDPIVADSAVVLVAPPVPLVSVVDAHAVIHTSTEATTRARRERP